MSISRKGKLLKNKQQNKSLTDYVSLGIATVGVGYLPIAPGTYGSAIGVLIYLIVRDFETRTLFNYIQNNSQPDAVYIWSHLINALLILLLCSVGIWAATRASVLFQVKDPQEVVVDEVMGQLITFLFVPFAISWWLVLSGFLLFRLFDIWKPYPIDLLQDLPGGLGVCVDDILAGVYAGMCLLLLYTIGISFL